MGYKKTASAIWGQAFRPFFLAGSLFSILALAIWVAGLNGKLTFSPYANILFWHGHEMLFGFVCAILVGFLLTAVQTWTGLRSTHGAALKALFGLWLAARILMLTGLEHFEWLVAVVDVSFLPAVAALAARLILKTRNYRNLPFVPILGLLALANLLTHLSFLLGKAELFNWGMYAAIMLISLLMIMVGGRVIPMFTANGTNTPKVVPLAWLEKTTLASAGLIAAIFITGAVQVLPNPLIAALFAIAALANATRAFRWHGWTSVAHPLVWSLHSAYWFIPTGLALFALHYADFAGFQIALTTALHCLTAGAMGSLILAMIARISLGHSGRPLKVRPIMNLAFIFIASSGLTRLLIGLNPQLISINGYSFAAALWILAYGIFFVVYFRILTTPRPDGRPG